ncbi:MAG: hypothetical protein MJ053_01780 [Elusimicrobiaceae bacterium]|nr:hypothetical protein [Elusimicrobiaceae bacterium]
MFKKFLPHMWFTLRGLAVIGKILFYVAFAVGIYALWGLVFPSENAAQLGRKIYVSAALQAALFCVAAGTLIHLLQTLASTVRALDTTKK